MCEIPRLPTPGKHGPADLHRLDSVFSVLYPVTSEMSPRLYLPIIDGVLLLIFFVVDPLIFVVVGYLAWKGKPGAFTHRKYGALALATLIPGFILVICGKLIDADVRTWQYIPQVFCMLFGLLLVGIGCACWLGFLIFEGHTHPNPVKMMLERLLEFFHSVSFLLVLHPIL